MPRDNRYMYITHAYLYVCCNDCVGVGGIVCCVVAVVKYSVFSFGVEACCIVCVRGVMDVVFSVCIATGEAAGARVWEV